MELANAYFINPETGEEILFNGVQEFKAELKHKEDEPIEYIKDISISCKCELTPEGCKFFRYQFLLAEKINDILLGMKKIRVREILTQSEVYI